MLKRILKIRLNLCFFSTSFSPDELLDEISNRRRSKFQENREMIENIFYPEFLKTARKEELKKILDKKSKNEYFINDDDEFAQVMRKQIISKKSISNNEVPKHMEEITRKLKKTYINEKLLNIYTELSNFFVYDDIIFFLNKLEFTLLNAEKIKKDEYVKYQRKKIMLNKINPNIDMKYTAIFLTKDQILIHKAWKFFIDDIEMKISKDILSNIEGICVARTILQFLIINFPENLLKALKNVSIYIYYYYFLLENRIKLS